MYRTNIIVALLTGLWLVATAHGGAARNPTAAESDAAWLAKRIEIIHTDQSVVVGLRDFDLAKRKFPNLKAMVTFLDPSGRAIDSFWINYTHEATPSHIVFNKNRKDAYSRVALTLEDRGRSLFEKELALPPQTRSARRAKVTDEIAALIPGTAFDEASAPAIKLLDYANPSLRSRTGVESLTITDPSRTIDIESCKKRVVSDFNFPTAGGTCLIANQTAFPDDPKKKSIYIPANNDLYDSKTGKYESTLKYLIEIPVDPAWVAGEGDKVIQVSSDKLRIHITTEEVKVRRLGVQRITGNRKGLLGQTINSYAVGEDGNIYFAMQYRSPIRFNVKKAKWEAPPVNVYDFHLKYKPKLEDLPYEKGFITDIRTDFNNVIFCHNRRVWVSTTRYAMFPTGTGGNSLCLASVLSIPMDHWDDKETFEKAMRFNAGSFPEAKFHLWSTHVAKNDRRRKLNVTMASGDRFCLLAYHYNYFWIMDVAGDGTTKKLTPVETLNGKRVMHFSHDARWVLRGEDVLGLQLEVTLEGEKKPRRSFLPMDAYNLTETFPEKSHTVPFHYRKRGALHNSAGAYGRVRVNKYSVAIPLGMPRVNGTLTLFYDAIERMKTHPGAYKEIIDRMSAASMGPEYYLVPVPGKRMEILGTSDYPAYNFARYDWSANASNVQKTFLTQDIGDIDVRLNMPALLGLYCHQWFRDGDDDVLYYAGYTGVARLKYRVNGKAPARHKVEKLFHGQNKHLCVDGAPDAYIKWYRDILPGLGDKVFLTGVNIAQRGGTAYSGGLMYFHRRTPNRLYKISEMSRCYKTKRLAARIRGEPGGALEQDVFLCGDFNAPDAETIPNEKRPGNTQPRVFVYADRGASGVHDLFGFTLSPAEASDVSIRDFAVSRNALYLLVSMKDGTLATFDLAAWRFVDAVRLPNSSGLLKTPDGGIMVTISEPKKELEEAPSKRAWITYVTVSVDGKGVIALAPHLRLTFNRDHRFGRKTWLYDSEKDDGSYDLMIGSNSQKPEGNITIVRDFIPPRL